MSKQYGWFRGWALAAALSLATLAAAQQPPSAAAPQAQVPAPQAQLAPPQATGKITPEQASQLFSLVDELIKFSSNETGLPIKNQVKRQITSRAIVESYLKEKFDEDESARRMQQSEIVLKKFGLLDRDFALKPFLLQLLKEQIEAYYDFKTKTVYMLDWVGIDEQKPVLAHELTHALQDQHTDLEKWSDQTPDEVSLNSPGDTDHLAKDEMDTARQAVVEGQATAVMMDYILKPMGKSLVKDPEVMDYINQQMSASQNSPMLTRAPLLLSESLLFPYRDGLSFEQDVWMDQGQTAAFTGTLDHPPTSSWEILNPREYEKRHMPAVPLLPNIHPLVDSLYKPYDIGQMGQLDVRILAELFGGEQAARDLTPAWDGGLYWAGQRLSAKTPADKAKTDSIAIFYLSAWRNAASAQAFAELYADELGRKYSSVQLESGSQSAAQPSHSSGFKVFPPPASPPDESSDATNSAPATLPGEQVYSTSEGPVVITTRGKLVFVAESFPLDLARKLTALILDAQGTGEMKMARAAQPILIGPFQPRAPSFPLLSAERVGDNEPNPSAVPALDSEIGEPLTASLIRFFSNCGVMKTAVEAGVKAAASEK
jgi:hypothetical protein